jgi:hypothetical protein
MSPDIDSRATLHGAKPIRICLFNKELVRRRAMVKAYIGLDVHKAQIVIAILARYSPSEAG